MSRSNLVDIAVEYRHQTANAILVNDGINDHWIPKSLAEFDPDPCSENSPAVIKNMTMTVPEWFAKKEGLI